MGTRPRHPHRDLEALLRDAEANGWEATRGKKYYELRCACGVHRRTLHLTPSDPNYERNVRAWLKRTGCWEDK